MSALYYTTYRFDVWFPGPPGLLVGVANVVTKYHLFVTYCALCHFITSFKKGYFKIQLTHFTKRLY